MKKSRGFKAKISIGKVLNALASNAPHIERKESVPLQKGARALISQSIVLALVSRVLFLGYCCLLLEISATMLALSSLLSFFLLFTPRVTEGTGIGVNYGKMATDLPSPFQVAQFLSQNTIFDRVKIFDSDPTTIQAFANTGLAIDVTISNDLIPQLTNISFAINWVRTNIIPYASATDIARILVGDEAISSANKALVLGLVPAMQNLHTALVSVSLHHRIKVSTAHSLGILAVSIPPSAGKFKEGYDTAVIKPLLKFLKATNSPFMVNAYPFFGFTIDTLEYALFRLNNGVFDNETGLVYTNMLDAQLDAIYSAVKRVGFTDIDIVIAKTGWPSVGGESEVGVTTDFARDYNKNLIRHVISGIGTPLMSNRTFETYIFELFNEDLKPGPVSEKNFGLFHADLTPVYDIGILKTEVGPNNFLQLFPLWLQTPLHISILHIPS